MGYLLVTGNIMKIIRVFLEFSFWVTYRFKCAEILNFACLSGK